MSSSLWVPLIWIFISASRNIGIWIDAGRGTRTGIGHLQESVYLEGSPLDRAIFSLLIIVGVTILIRRKIKWLQVFKTNYFIFLLFIYMGVSILWSDFALIGFKRWIKTCGDLVMTLIILTKPNSLESIKAVLRRCFYIHIPASIFAIIFFRHLGVGVDSLGNEMWVGITTHKNTLGAVTMLSSGFFIWSHFSSRNKSNLIINLSYILMSFTLLLGSHSSTSILILLLGGIVFTMLQWTKSNPKVTKLFTGSMIILVMCFSLIFPTRPEVFTQKTQWLISGASRDVTLTGRTDLWYDMLQIAWQHPFLGVGYGSFWIGDLANKLWESHYWRPSQGHNGYLDVFVELGVVGIILLVSVIYAISRNIMDTFRTDFEYAAFRMTVFIMLLVHNITESSFLRGNDTLWLIFLVVALYIPSEYIKISETNGIEALNGHTKKVWP
jgi:exopolysaccharide production protein ExoQ